MPAFYFQLWLFYSLEGLQSVTSPLHFQYTAILSFRGNQFHTVLFLYSLARFRKKKKKKAVLSEWFAWRGHAALEHSNPNCLSWRHWSILSADCYINKAALKGHFLKPGQFLWTKTLRMPSLSFSRKKNFSSVWTHIKIFHLLARLSQPFLKFLFLIHICLSIQG